MHYAYCGALVRHVESVMESVSVTMPTFADEHAVEHDADFGALAAMLESVGGDETSDGADELPEGDPPRSIRAGTLCTSERLRVLRGQGARSARRTRRWPS